MSYSYKVCPKTEQILPIVVDAYNHFWDSCVAEGSLVETLSGPKKIEDVQVGDFVPTRSGWQRVNGKRLTQKNAPIMRLETENRVLLATPNHEVWTEEKGFVRMDALRYADTILAYRGESKCPKSMGATNSAQTPASLRGEEKQGLMMFKRHAPSAVLSSHRTNTQNYHFVPESVLSITDAGVSDVYDLSVENCPEFSASGILVHNCRYAVSLLVKAQGAYILDETELEELDVEDY